MDKICLFWFRRDLRLADNHGLFQALKSGNKVLPLFIFDTTILEKLEDKKDARVTFIHQTLLELKKAIGEHGSDLLVEHGTPVEVFEKLLNQYPLASVYCNRDYEPQAIKRDQAVADLLAERGCAFKDFKDQVIFEMDEVVKENGEPYTVYTPYSKSWKKKLIEQPIVSYPSEDHLNELQKTWTFDFPNLANMGFEETETSFPSIEVPQKRIANYHLNRDIPSIEGTSRLSIHFRFGTVSIREKAKKASQLNEKYFNELIWRDFYQMILSHFPRVVGEAFKPAYDAIVWRNNEKEFKAWCEGKTGYPLVDAGMRELNQTGFMHNRVRMVVASFLCKHLLIDWRWGEAYFAAKLLDFDLASNNGGWQWAAGSGVDAAPYFRVFNPYLQQEKFDPQYLYVKKWVKEYGSSAYPKPIVEHTFARNRCLEAYKSALAKAP